MHPRYLTTLCAAFLLALCAVNFGYRYDFPQKPLLDEHYYITDAQRYIAGTFFVKHNPPLGKLMVAAGEALLQRDNEPDLFLDVTLAKTFPADFDYSGYRFFPMLTGMLTPVITFFIFVGLSLSPVIALLLALPLAFESAFIVQSRSGMLEGILLFCTALSVLCAVHLFRTPIEKKRRLFVWSGLFGLFYGLAVSTKFTALILAGLALGLLWIHRTHWKTGLQCAGIAIAVFFIANIAVWQTHFSLASTIHPDLPRDGTFGVSQEYIDLLPQGGNKSLLNFPLMFRDTLVFSESYNRRIPPLNKRTKKLGSLPHHWPFGGHAALYLRERGSDNTNRLLYLHANPIGLAIGLAGTVGSVVFLAFQWKKRKKGWRHFIDEHVMLLSLLLMYFSYLGVMSTVRRVLFLYHFFIPYFLSFVAFGVLLQTIARVRKWHIDRLVYVAGLVAVLSFMSFEWYRPYIYYEALSKKEVEMRAGPAFWMLNCEECVWDDPKSTQVPQSSQ